MSARLMVDVSGPLLTEEDCDLLSRPEVGGLILFTRNYRDREQLKRLVAAVRGLNPGILIAVDQEGGRVQRLQEGFHRLPALGRIGQLAERDEGQAILAARSLAWLMAAEVVAVGVDISFAPVLDLALVPSQVIGDRALGSDAARVSRLAKAYVQGMQAAGMAVTGKHFPGHGGVGADSHLELPRDARSLDEIWDLDLLPYRQLGDSLDAVMSAHICFDQVDSQPVSFSARWLKQILREQIGFRGRVFSDDLSMAGAAGVGSYAQRANLALHAGCDMLILCNNRNGAVEVADWLAGQGQLQPLDWTPMRARRSWNPDLISDHPWYEEAQRSLKQLK